MQHHADGDPAAALRAAFARYEGPLHPDDLAAIRHGGLRALSRCRARDLVLVLDGRLQAALAAVRAARSRSGPVGVRENRGRLLGLRSAALLGLASAGRI